MSKQPSLTSHHQKKGVNKSNPVANLIDGSETSLPKDPKWGFSDENKLGYSKNLLT